MIKTWLKYDIQIIEWIVLAQHDESIAIEILALKFLQIVKNWYCWWSNLLRHHVDNISDKTVMLNYAAIEDIAEWKYSVNYSFSTTYVLYSFWTIKLTV